MVNKFFYKKGGSETYYFSLKQLLEQNGIEVIDFSMKDDKNFPSKTSEFFVENIDYNHFESIWNSIKIGCKVIYSFEAKRKIEKLIKKEKPDIVHLHMFQHQISLSILDVFKKYNIPVVYTAHELKMICPNYLMLSNNKVCEKCRGHQYYHCLFSKCIKNSYLKSMIAMIEAYLHYFKKSYFLIDTIIVPSKFYYQKFIEFGVTKDRLHFLPNFLPNKDDKQVLSKGDYYLYFGRISLEKGLKILINAFKTFNGKLLIAGTGPMLEQYKTMVKENKQKNVVFLGHCDKERLKNIIQGSKCIIIPSEWYENCPYSAIETLELGKPIIGANIGGIPEFIEEGKNGFIFESGNLKSLEKCLQRFEALGKKEYKTFCDYSYQLYLNYYTEERHYKEIIKIYEDLIKKNKNMNEKNKNNT